MPLPGTAEVRDLCVECHDRQIIASQVTLADDYEKCEIRLSHVCRACHYDHNLGWAPTTLTVWVRASVMKKISMTDKQTCHNGASINARDGAWMSAVNSVVREVTQEEEDRAQVAGYLVRGLEVNGIDMYMPLWARGLYMTVKVNFLLVTHAVMWYKRLVTNFIGNATDCMEMVAGRQESCHEIIMIWQLIFMAYSVILSVQAFWYVNRPHRFAKVVLLEKNGTYKRERLVPPVTFMPKWNKWFLVRLCRWVSGRVKDYRSRPNVSSASAEESGLTTPLLGNQPDIESGDMFAGMRTNNSAPLSSNASSSGSAVVHTPPLCSDSSDVPYGNLSPRSMDATASVASNVPESNPSDSASGDGVPGSSNDQRAAVKEEPFTDYSRYRDLIEKQKALKRPVPDAPDKSHEFDCIRGDPNIALCHDPGVVVGGAAIVNGTYMTPALHENSAAKVEEAINNRGYDNGNYVAPQALPDDIARDLHVIAKELCGAVEVPGETVDGKKQMKWVSKPPRNGKHDYAPFSRLRIINAAERIISLKDYKATKWTEERFYDCWFEALATFAPAGVTAQVKQEVYKMKANGEAKPPRLISNCGGVNQVRSLLIITVFELLLWSHAPYEVLSDGSQKRFVTLPDLAPPNERGHFNQHIKGAPKQACCLKVRDALTKRYLEPDESSYFVEGDGKNWDFTVRLPALDALENKIFTWITNVLQEYDIPGIDLAIPDLELRKQKFLKLVFKQHPSDKAKGAENIVFKINNCRRSGDRATSSANYLVNKVFWTLAYFPAREAKKLLCHKYADGSHILHAKNRWNQIQYFNLFCEGDDMLANIRIFNDTDTLHEIRKAAVTKFFKDSGFLMDIIVAREGDKTPVTFAGITYSNHIPPKKIQKKDGKIRYVSQMGTIYAPQLGRMLQKTGVTTCAEGVASAKAGDVEKMRSAEAHKYVAWAVNCVHFPQLMIKWLNKAESVMPQTSYSHTLDRQHHYNVYGGIQEDPETLGALIKRLRELTGTADVCTEATRWTHVGSKVDGLDYVHFTTMAPDAGSFEMRQAAASIL